MSWQPEVILGPLAQYDCFYDTTVPSYCPQLQPRNLVLPFNINFGVPGIPAGGWAYNPPAPNDQVVAPTRGANNQDGSYYPPYLNEYARQFQHPDFVSGTRSNNVYNYNPTVVQPVFGAGPNFQVTWSSVEPVIVPPFIHSNDLSVPGKRPFA